MTFSAWFANPPVFAPWRLTIEIRGARAQLTRTRAADLSAPVDPTDAYLMTLEKGRGQGQRAAAEWLGENKVERAVPGLISLLETSNWNQARQAAAKSLGQIGGAEARAAVPAIQRAAMAETDQWALSDYLAALSALGGPEAVSALKEIAASHPDPGARQRAQTELARL